MGLLSNSKRALSSFILNLAFGGLLLLHATAAATNSPQVLYTDLASGPNSGGENNKGAYLSIFGLNFGVAGDLGTNTKVYINNIEVDNYRYLGASNGRTDIQQITVQVGALGNPTPGVPLAVKVVAGGIASNTDMKFIVNPGRILFVDNVTGNDTTGVPNDILHPWRYVQTPSNGGAYGAVQPGDIIVMRGKGVAWTDLGNNNSFLRFSTKGGSQPTGALGSGPITVTSYPAETVRIVNTANYGISGVNRSSGLPYSNYSTWITISGLSIQGDGGAGPIALQVYADYWRIVNNELKAPNATTAKAGGVNGNGGYVSILGNNIHDIAGNQQENHGVYIDGGSDIPAGTVEIAFNRIYNITGGNCIQQYNNGTNGDFYPTNNILIHHNVVHDTTKHGINIADGSGTGYQIYNNIVYNTQYAGVRFNTTDLVGCKIYNNSFYNTDTAVSPNYGSLTNDWNLGSNAVDIRNNIFWPHAGTKYNGGSNGMSAGMGTVSNNLWYGGSDSTPTFDTAPRAGNPQFVSPGTDFHVGAASPAVDMGSNGVSSVVSNDYAMTARPQGVGFDIGAYEFVAPGNPLPTVTLALSGSPLAESGGVATVTATLSAASAQIVTVNLGFSGSATNGTDYVPSANSIIINPGATTGSITLTGVNDTLDEPNETIIVDILSVTNGTESGTQQVTATIIDDDNPPTVTLSLIGNLLAKSGDVATVTATLSAASAQVVTVNLSFSGTAINGTDYTPSTTSIIIPSGKLNGSITLTDINDTLAKPSETIIVDIATVSNSTESGTQQVTATITSKVPVNHAPSILSFSYLPDAPKVGDTITFIVAATDSDGDILTSSFNYNDGTTDSTGVHSYSVPGTYSVVVSVSDGKSLGVTTSVTVAVGSGGMGSPGDSDGDGVSDVNEIADGTNPFDPNSFLKTPMTVSKLSGKTSFKSTNRDSCSVTGVIPSLPASFKLDGASVNVDVGGANANFNLNGRGNASSESGSFSLKTKHSRNHEFAGGNTPFKAVLKLGTWSDDWGIPQNTAMIKQRILIVVNIRCAGRIYTANVEPLCTSKPGNGARFKL